jgi:HNH endonuclease
MRFWLGVTDNRWFQHVATHKFGEVNFWQPSAKAPFVDAPEGTPFLFKLKRPHHHIAGGGHFVRHTRLPLATAWDVFGQQNGAESLRIFHQLIAANRPEPPGLDTEIGCTVVTDVFYLPQERWIPVGERFAREIMVGKFYDATQPVAQELWQEVIAARQSAGIAEPDLEQPRYGRSFLARARLGQGSFRTLVIDAYGRRCAVTGENTLPALEAAHIQPYADLGPHQVSNGLLLRSDFHKLFDAGLVTIEPDYKIRISGRIRDQYFNGKAYYRLHGQQLAQLPADSQDHPNREFLTWHNTHRFVA